MTKINLNKLKRYSINTRKNKVNKAFFAKVPAKGISFDKFFAGLPKILAANLLRDAVDAIVKARKAKKTVIVMMGAHVIKCGLSPLIIELMRKGIVKAIALNGAGIIHDTEIAMIGQTSEDVMAAIKDGSFGMAKETADFINASIRDGAACDISIGEAIAKNIAKENFKYKGQSILYNALKYGVTVTVHIAIGTDIIHQHATCDGASIGKASLNDFRRFIGEVAKLQRGSVVLNIGSAVILPEVFLKAVTTARNLGHKVKGFTAINMDMSYHYRPMQNVLLRPTSSGGTPIYLIGHHEIMVPLLVTALLQRRL